MNPYTLEEFVKLASEKHDNFYTYTDSVYVDSLTPITIECPKHGKFSQRPSIHLSGVGCKMCGIEKARKSRTYHTAYFIDKAKKTHGDKYDYSLVEYKTSKSKVLILCYEHGEFWQRAASHWSGAGCPACAHTGRTLEVEKVIQGFRETHGEFYDYSLMNYKSVDTKIKIVCPIHSEFWQTPYNHRLGNGCPKCKGVKISKAKTLDLEQVLKDFKKVHGDKYDYSLVEYKDSSTKIRIGCPIHGEFLQLPSNHKAGQGCLECAKKAKFLDLEKVIQDFRKVHGDFYDYSKVDYKHSMSKIKIRCPLHGEFWQIASTHKRGCGCPKCGDIAKTLTLEQVITAFKEAHGDFYDYSLVQYENSNSKISIKCPIHGEFSQVAHHHAFGHGCPKCGKESRTLTREEAISEFKAVHGNRYDYSTTEYKNTSTKISIFCRDHGEFFQLPSHHKKGHGCPSCSVRTSKGQTELTQFLQSLTEVQTDYIYDRSISKREVDCYLPEFNLAVEYEGLWWHSTKYREPNFHKQKKNELKAVGIDLIRIFEDEWLTKQEQVKNLLAMRLGKNPNKIYARQTQLEPISSEEAKDFYNLYHIQGQARANGVSLCLKHEDKVVAVMTFTQNFSHRGLVQENLQELSRFASSIQVVGGASKLFKALIKLTKAEEVVSYSDNRLFTGKTYEALGFTKEHESRPDYYYVRNNQFTRLHKSNFRHSNLPKMIGDLYDPSLTEKQNAENAGWYQIYNCGLTKWRYKV